MRVARARSERPCPRTVRSSFGGRTAQTAAEITDPPPPSPSAPAALGRAPSVEPCAETGEHFGHLWHKVVIDLALFNDDDAGASRTEESVDHLESEPREAFAVLHDNEPELRLRQRLEQLGAGRVHTRPDLGNHLVHLDAMALRMLEQPQLLPIQTGSLLAGRDACVRHGEEPSVVDDPHVPELADTHRVELCRKRPEVDHLPSGSGSDPMQLCPAGKTDAP